MTLDSFLIVYLPIIDEAPSLCYTSFDQDKDIRVNKTKLDCKIGVEPITFSVEVKCSTNELHACKFLYNDYPFSILSGDMWSRTTIKLVSNIYSLYYQRRVVVLICVVELTIR